MTIDSAHDRLEDRLATLASLHAGGHLDDTEFRTAKAAVLHSRESLPASPPVEPSVRTLGPLRWKTWMLIAMVFGFFIACLGSAITDLQAPAAPILCSGGDFAAGNDVEQFGGTTSYNVDTTCTAADGETRQLSQLAVVGVLWIEYGAALFLLIAVFVWIIRGLRGPPRLDAVGPSERTILETSPIA
jgi:hypothetical protein